MYMILLVEVLIVYFEHVMCRCLHVLRAHFSYVLFTEFSMADVPIEVCVICLLLVCGKRSLQTRTSSPRSEHASLP